MFPQTLEKIDSAPGNGAPCRGPPTRKPAPWQGAGPMLCQAQASARRSRGARLEPPFAQGRPFETPRRSRPGFARSSSVRRRGGSGPPGELRSPAKWRRKALRRLNPAPGNGSAAGPQAHGLPSSIGSGRAECESLGNGRPQPLESPKRARKWPRRGRPCGRQKTAARIPSPRRVDRRIRARRARLCGAGRPNVWLRPRSIDIKAEMRGVRRFLAGGPVCTALTRKFQVCAGRSIEP